MKLHRFLAWISGAILCSVIAHASVSFPFNAVHTGGTPSGPAPWASMTITDIVRRC